VNNVNPNNPSTNISSQHQESQTSVPHRPCTTTTLSSSLGFIFSPQPTRASNMSSQHQESQVSVSNRPGTLGHHPLIFVGVRVSPQPTRVVFTPTYGFRWGSFHSPQPTRARCSRCFFLTEHICIAAQRWIPCPSTETRCLA